MKLIINKLKGIKQPSHSFIRKKNHRRSLHCELAFESEIQAHLTWYQSNVGIGPKTHVGREGLAVPHCQSSHDIG